MMDGHSNWPEARLQCQRVGGFLAEFESFEEHIHVTNMIGFCRWLYFHVLGYIEGSLTLLAPSGALVVIMVYYIPAAQATHFFKFFKFFRF